MNISVEDVNEWEPRFRYTRYEFHAPSAREGSIVGKFSLCCILNVDPTFYCTIFEKRVTFQEDWKQLTVIEATKSAYLSEGKMRGTNYLLNESNVI